MKVAVLCYHSNNVLGGEYFNNDHLALAEDVAMLARRGIPVLPLRDVVNELGAADAVIDRAVAITFDDGSWFDWYDLEHPTLGLQRSFAAILRDRGVPGTAFVIASPEARDTLDRTCLIGKGWWTDGWWSEAERSGLLAIENHSWDHNHETLQETCLPAHTRGAFRDVLDAPAADAELRLASEYIASICGAAAGRLLAYPYGHYSDYLIRDYLPGQQLIRAAFTTDPEPVCIDSDRWRLGRYVCGQHWRSPQALSDLLDAAFA